jgi:hypothetical protein
MHAPNCLSSCHPGGSPATTTTSTTTISTTKTPACLLRLMLIIFIMKFPHPCAPSSCESYGGMHASTDGVPRSTRYWTRRGAEMRRVSAALMPGRRRRAASGTENDNARLRGSLNDAPRPRAVFGRPFKSWGPFLICFWRGRMGRFSLLKARSA